MKEEEWWKLLTLEEQEDLLKEYEKSTEEKNNNLTKKHINLLKEKIELYQDWINLYQQKIGVVANKEEVFDDIKQKNHNFWFSKGALLYTACVSVYYAILYMIDNAQIIPFELISYMTAGVIFSATVVTTGYHLSNIFKKHSLNQNIKNIDIEFLNTKVKLYENQKREAQIELYELNQEFYQPATNKEKQFDNGLLTEDIDLKPKKLIR